MKITAKNLGMLFGIIGVILILGCIGEKPEEKQAGTNLENKQAELENKQSQLEKKQAELEDKQSQLEKKQAEIEEKFTKTINEIESGENRSWCEITAAKKYGAEGKSIWIEGVIEFKGKPMCHLRNLITGVNGTTPYDWYFTENEEEIWRVITYPNGTIEESKVV
jgi:DNA-binding transcriptional MerR regulator